MPRNTAEYGRPAEYEDQEPDWRRAQGSERLDAANAPPIRDLEALTLHVLECWREVERDPDINSTSFTKAILSPTVEQGPAGGMNHSGGDSRQGVDLEGQTSDPINHLRTSFARIVREKLDLPGLESAQGPHQLAEAVLEHLPAVDAMAHYLRGLNDQLEDGQAEWADPPWYRPQVLWERSLEGNWDTVMELTGKGANPEALAEDVARLLDQAAEAFTEFKSGEEYINAAQYQGGADDPKTLMLREATWDMYTAFECAVALGDLPEEQTAGGEGEEFLHREVRNLALNDMSRELRDELEGSLSAREIALYDRVLRSLAHADFNIMAAHNQPEEGPQTATD